ncbi:hypothetical protein XELAEV_18012620mg [Xenopus laevis]|uniref:Uncharacterized protein n=1 Tax=Xenopus laevis TaxID=8355 RepID=A0A974HYV5_XENLA|nr:hypothetical protein XELAEV_18012620mg [Xenopus laevis]
MFPNIPDICWRCGQIDGNLTHIMWHCLSIQPYWTQIIQMLPRFTDMAIIYPAPFFLLHYSEMSLTQNKKINYLNPNNSVKGFDTTFLEIEHCSYTERLGT